MRRTISVLLALLMILGVFGTGAFAAETVSKVWKNCLKNSKIEETSGGMQDEFHTG